MRVVAVGGGKLVYFLARALTADGHQVTVVNHDPAECVWLARRLGSTVVHGEGSDPDVLDEAGAAACHAVLALTAHDHDNLVICQLARRHFGVGRTLALVNDPEHAAVFRQLGVTFAVSPTQLLATLIEQEVEQDEGSPPPVLTGADVVVTEVVVPEDSPLLGCRLDDLEVPDELVLACVIRDERSLIPRGRLVLEPGDRVLAVTLPDCAQAAVRFVTGKPA